jgi:hypothetical protein
MRILVAILLGGVISGALDIVYAFIVYGPLSYGVSPEGVLHSVAAGWIGREAAQAGGLNTALLGLGSHFLIAAIMAAVFIFVAQAFSALTARAIVWGFVYGLILYVAMNYIVVPLSAAGAIGHFATSIGEASARVQDAFSTIRPRYDAEYPWMIPGTILTHTVLVGIPIALIAKRFAQSA